MRSTLVFLTLAVLASSASAHDNHDTKLRRTSVNPVEWGLAYQMDQAELVAGYTRILHLSGQTSLVEDAEAPMGVVASHPDDLRGQFKASLAAIDAILEKAGMTRANLIHLRFFTTDMDGALANYDVYADWIAEAGIRPPQSFLGIDRLVLPELKIEIEAVAAD